MPSYKIPFMVQNFYDNGNVKEPTEMCCIPNYVYGHEEDLMWVEPKTYSCEVTVLDSYRGRSARGVGVEATPLDPEVQDFADFRASMSMHYLIEAIEHAQYVARKGKCLILQGTFIPIKRGKNYLLVYDKG